MNILITGINGFVGSNMYHYFSEGNNIFGIDISKDISKQKSKYYNWNNLKDIPDVDAIIHLAGLAHDTEGGANERDYYEINVGLTQKIFEHYLSSSAKIFIHFSSVKAVADSVIGEFLSEDTIAQPKTHYGKSKLASEKYLSNQIIPAFKNIYILRPAMIHGPGNKGNLNLLYSMVRKGIPYPLGNFKNQRSFTSIGNLLFIVNLLLAGNIKSGTYNICDDEPLSTIEIVEMIYGSLGKKNMVLNIPCNIIQKLAALGNILKLPLNSERLQKMTESYIVSNEKIKRELSLQSLPVSSRTGMLRTLNTLQN